jgi:transcriptional regulator with XRE-family HTH domain
MAASFKTSPILASLAEAAMSIGSRIQSLRATKGWSQEELAKKLKTSGPNVSRWENNHGIPSVDALRELAQTFDVSVDYFLFDEAPMRPLSSLKDPDLAQQISQIDSLDEQDRAALKRFIKALTNEKRMRELLDKAS